MWELVEVDMEYLAHTRYELKSCVAFTYLDYELRDINNLLINYVDISDNKC